ncbi:phage scaffold protein, partial [Streptococcus suis]
MSNFKPIETQEELDRIISERLARQKEKYADYDQVKARVSELEKENGVLKSAAESSKANTADFEKQIAELQGQVKNYESKDLRLRVAVAKG